MTYLEAVTSNRSDALDMNFPLRHDYNGSLKGVVVLHNTFDFDVTMAANGILSFVDHDREVSLPSAERITTSDQVALAERAIAAKFYDSAVDFIREALKFNGVRKGSSIYKKIISIKDFLVKKTNDLMKRHHRVVGDDFRIKPHYLGSNLEAVPVDFPFEGDHYLPYP